jgi:hypothetical protein
MYKNIYGPDFLDFKVSFGNTFFMTIVPCYVLFHTFLEPPHLDNWFGRYTHLKLVSYAEFFDSILAKLAQPFCSHETWTLWPFFTSFHSPFQDVFNMKDVKLPTLFLLFALPCYLVMYSSSYNVLKSPCWAIFVLH